jgi:hypothetical protein
VANAVSLTPGTLTLDVDPDPPVLYVHVLHLRDVDRLRREVAPLELLVTQAFGTAAAVRNVEQDDMPAEPTSSQAMDAVRTEQ